MSIRVRGASDGDIDHVVRALERHQAQHPHAEIEVYRQNSVSIRLRIVNPEFSGVNRAERHDIIWRVLEGLPEEVQSQLSLLLPLTPEETSTSVANFEFDNPIPSSL